MKTNLLLFLLAALLAIPTALTLRAERVRFTEIKDLPLLFDGFDPAAVAGLGIAKGWRDPGDQPQQQQQPPIEELQIRREAADRWVLANTDLAGAPVRHQRVVDEVLEHLGRIRRDERSVHRAKATPEELKQFGLTKEDGYLIVAFDAQNRVLAELVVGKDTTGGQWDNRSVRGRYVRARANESVLLYEVEHLVPSVTPTDWVDLRIFQADLSKVVGFSVLNPTVTEAVVLRKDSAQQAEWKVEKAPPKTGAPRQGDVQQLVQKVSLVDADRFLAPLDAEALKKKGYELARLGLEPPLHAVTYTLESGEVLQLHLGKPVEDRPEVYARSNRSRFLFTVPTWMKSDLDRDLGKLFDPSPEALKDK